MIDLRPLDYTDWLREGFGVELRDGYCPEPQVWHAPAERVSAVLGPDGEPLRVGYDRPRMGFDLTPVSRRSK